MIVYRIHLDGFTSTFETLAELQAWVADLKRRYRDLIGKTATVHRGTRVGTTDSFIGAGASIVVGA